MELKLSVEKIEIQKITLNGVSFYAVEPLLFLAKDAEGKPKIINGVPKELEQLKALMSFAETAPAAKKGNGGTSTPRQRAPRKSTTPAPGAANLNAEHQAPGQQQVPDKTL